MKSTIIKKSKTYFYRNSKVVSQRKNLRDLYIEKNKILKKMKKLYEMFSMSDELLRDISLASMLLKIKELEIDAKAVDFNALRILLKTEHDRAREDLAKIKGEISIGEIDLLLAKVDCVQDKLK